MAISFANIPPKHGVAKLQFTCQRSDLQFKFSSVRQCHSVTLAVNLAGEKRRLKTEYIYIVLYVYKDNKITATYSPNLNYD